MRFYIPQKFYLDELLIISSIKENDYTILRTDDLFEEITRINIFKALD